MKSRSIIFVPLKGWFVFLIVDIGGAAKTTCLIYGLHDDGLNNTYFFTVNPTQYFEINPLGESHTTYDIEALDMNSKGEIDASSGNDAKKGNPNRHLYRLDRSQGQITSVGDICFSWNGETFCGAEVSALTFHPKIKKPFPCYSIGLNNGWNIIV